MMCLMCTLTVSSEMKSSIADVLISVSFREMPQDLYLSRSQRIFTHMFGEMSCHLRGNAFFARVRLTDDLDEILRRRGLEHITAGASLQRALDLHVAFESREHHNASVRVFRADGDQRIDAADIRKSQIHQGHIRLVLTKLLDGFMARSCLSYQKHVRLIFDEYGNPLSQQRMIIDTENTYETCSLIVSFLYSFP